MSVKAKKHLGQHFLKDRGVCQRISDQYKEHKGCKKVLEVGPGMGALTEFLLARDLDVWAMEVDRDSVPYLNEHFPALHGKIIEADFLKIDLKSVMGVEPYAVVGNFPYNISSQILFTCLEHRNQIPEIMGMFQREVAQRIVAEPGSKAYGRLALLAQWRADARIVINLPPEAFTPHPKVSSAVVHLTALSEPRFPADAATLSRIVAAGFNQRRKMLRSSLKGIAPDIEDRLIASGIKPTERAEQVSLEQFCALARAVLQP